jgi:SAM-dependent methyltransferase
MRSPNAPGNDGNVRSGAGTSSGATGVSLIRLNVGCGGQRPEGWINTDSSLSSLLQSMPMLGRMLGPLFATRYTAPARYLDLRRRWPFRDASCAVVYASHVFEHLDRAGADFFLHEAWRVLCPGGTLRIVVPDLQALARTYLDAIEREPSPEHAREFLRWMNLHLDETYPRSVGRLRLWVARRQGYPHQHKYMYDAMSLADVVAAGGFGSLRFHRYAVSDAIPDIAAVECTAEGVPSIYLEATKPHASEKAGA